MTAVLDKDRIASMRALAQWYHELGPDQPNLAPLGDDKRPVVTGISDNGRPWRFSWQEWQETRQTDALWQGIRSKAYWSECHGVALVNGFGGWVNIDIDSRAKADVAQPPVPRAVVDEFLSVLGLPADYPWLVASPTGGWHLYAIVDSLDIETGKLDRLHAHPAVDHVELRYTGHYTALPGSLHPNGRLYAWANAQPTETPAHVDGARLLTAYLALTQAKQKPASPARAATHAPSSHSAYVAKAVADEAARVSSAPSGSRNDTLNAAAFALGTLVGAGALSETDAEAALLSAAQACGLTEGEALPTIHSGLESGRQHPRQIPESTQHVDEGDWIPDLFAAETPDHWGDDSIAAVPVDEGDEQATARQQGPLPLSVSETVELYLGDMGRLSYSELDDRIYVNHRPLTDADLAPAKVRIHDHNGRLGKNSVEPYLPIGAIEPVVLQIATHNRFHPVKDWIKSLEWDGSDHVHNLSGYFLDTHESIKSNERIYSVFEALFSLWLIGAVDRVMNGTQNPVLVLAGPQGIGKSFLPWWLAQSVAIANGFDPRNNPFYCEGNINPESVEHLRRLSSKFVWEIGEVGATMRRSDIDALKQFLTEGSATYRVPYAKYEISKPALCSWIATVNPTVGFLNDPTGNRRFRTVELKGIDWNYSKDIDPMQVWAQAAHLWRNGATGDLSTAEKIIINQINSDHTKTSDEYEVIMQRYEFNPAQEAWHVYTADVVDDLIQNVPSCKTTNITRVGTALSQFTGSASKRLKGAGFDGRSGYRGVRKMSEAQRMNQLAAYNGL